MIDFIHYNHRPLFTGEQKQVCVQVITNTTTENGNYIWKIYLSLAPTVLFVLKQEQTIGSKMLS